MSKLNYSKLMAIENKIKKYQQIISNLDTKEHMNAPTSDDVVKLMKVRFRDILPLFKGCSYSNDINNLLMFLYVFYAGQIYEDSQLTGCYKGPAIHRVKTILNKYLPLLHHSRWDEIEFICHVYTTLNHIGKSK